MADNACPMPEYEARHPIECEGATEAWHPLEYAAIPLEPYDGPTWREQQADRVFALDLADMLDRIEAALHEGLWRLTAQVHAELTAEHPELAPQVAQLLVKAG
jgi:hypothetical protein